MLLMGCSSSNAHQTSQLNNRIVYGLTFEPSGFDPHIHASSELGIPLRQVYDTLVYRDPATSTFVPGLASTWEISPDGLSYTFTLRQGVTFHDDTPFNAQAVGANLDRITNPSVASQKAIFMLGSYTGYEILDEYTIKLNLSMPYSPLLDSLSQVYLGMASPTALGEYSNERYQFHQVGTGPFRMTEYVPGDRLVIQRNENYGWAPSFYTAPVENSVNVVEFRFFSDPASRAVALDSDDAQIMGELLPIDARALSVREDIQLMPVTIPGQPLQFLMNVNRAPTNNILVRQALLFGSNREVIIDSVFERFSPVAWGPLSAVTPFYNNQVSGSYAFDQNQARTLLEQAGYQDLDRNGYYDFNGGDLEVIVIVPSFGFVPEVVQVLQEQWRAIGVRAILDSAPSRSLVVERINTGEYNLVAWYAFGSDPAFLGDFYLSGGATNWTGYQNTELDNLLVNAAQQGDVNGRATIYAQVQRHIMEQALILPIRDYVNLNAARSNIHGLTFDAYGWFPILNNVTIGAPS